MTLKELHELIQKNKKADFFLALEKYLENPDHSIEDRLEGDVFLVSAADAFPEIVEYLLQKGAQVNAQNDLGMTALHSARFFSGNNIESTTILLKYKANPNIKDNQGNTTLHYVDPICPKAEIIIQLLLDCKADINATNNHGDTLIDKIWSPIAFTNSRILVTKRVVEYLIFQGATVSEKIMKRIAILRPSEIEKIYTILEETWSYISMAKKYPPLVIESMRSFVKFEEEIYESIRSKYPDRLCSISQNKIRELADEQQCRTSDKMLCAIQKMLGHYTLTSLDIQRYVKCEEHNIKITNSFRESAYQLAVQTQLAKDLIAIINQYLNQYLGMKSTFKRTFEQSRQALVFTSPVTAHIGNNEKPVVKTKARKKFRL